jgi:hypothetical protein
MDRLRDVFFISIVWLYIKIHNILKREPDIIANLNSKLS